MNRILKARLTTYLVILCAWSAMSSAVSAADLASWADQKLAPYVASQLTEHPRFRGETVVFVALENGAPAPVTNALALALRDRLVNAIVDRPGITIGWQSASEQARRDGSNIDCTRDTVHYYLGLEVVQGMQDEYRVTLRVLDAEDRSWVSGTSRSWAGRLTKKQKQAFKQVVTDDYFRGSREVPFSAAQSDILAAQLAHELSCKLLRQVAGEYVIATPGESGDTAATAPLAGALALVRNNLAGNPSLQITSQASAANASLEAKAHPIVGDLHQYWVSITPTSNDLALSPVSVSAYVRLTPSPRAPVATTATSVPMPVNPLPVNMTAPELISPLRIVEPRQRKSCYRAGSTKRQQRLVTADHTVGRGDCFLLQTRADRDASVFLLNYQVIHGLVNLSGRACDQSASWLRARAGETLLFPAANEGRPAASAWQGHPGLESFYVIAVSDPAVARELGRLVDQLPSRCSLAAAHGLVGPELQAWLAGLSEFTDRWQPSLQWQAVRVEHVY